MIDNIEEEDKKFLLKVARDAIWSKLVNEELPVYYKDKEIYKESPGVIIKLKVAKKLRGYIGVLQPQKQLIETVQDIAIKTCFDDPRFVPLQKEEYENLSLEIFIIKEINEIRNIKALKPSKDGLFVKSDTIEGLLLPDDFSQFEFTPEQYLKETEIKTGLPKDAKNIQYFVVDFIKIYE